MASSHFVPTDRAVSGGEALPKAVQRCFFLLAGLWLLWFVAFGIAHGVMGLGYPYDHLTLPNGHRMDLLGFLTKWPKLHTAAFYTDKRDVPFEYPAPAAFCYQALYSTGHCYAAYVAIAVVVVGCAAVLLSRRLLALHLRPYAVAAVVTAMFALSYPLLFTLVQANIELLIVAICGAALLLYLRGNYFLSAVLLGFAASVKIFPFVFLALFIPPKKYKALACGVLTIALSTLAGLSFLGPTIALASQGISAGLRENRASIILFFDHQNAGFDHSLFGVVKRVFNPKALTMTFPDHVLTGYMAVAALCGCALWFFRIRKLPILNQIVCFSLVVVVLPPTSYDYTLLHLYLPWSLLLLYVCAAARQGATVREAATTLVLFGVAFSPLNEFIYKSCSFAGQLKCLVLLTILYQALRTPWTLETSTYGGLQSKAE